MADKRDKPRGMASFSDVARPIEKPNTGNESSSKPEEVTPVERVEDQETVSTTEAEKPLQIDDIVSTITATRKQPKKRQVNFYIDEDVIKELEKFNKKHGKGAKSNLVNEFLRQVFKL